VGGTKSGQRQENIKILRSMHFSTRKYSQITVPDDGFFEWLAGKGSKQPMLLTLPDKKPFAFAGLWETWDDQGKRETPYRSCTILTRESSESVMRES